MEVKELDLSTDIANYTDFCLEMAPNLRNLCNLWITGLFFHESDYDL